MSCYSFSHRVILCLLGLFFLTPTALQAAKDAPAVDVGIARVDISPTGPIRLSGYAHRNAETETIAMPLWAKAIAIGSEEQGGPAILVMVENCGVPKEMADKVKQTVRDRCGIPPERIAIASTHTHSAPWIRGFLPFLTRADLPEEHRRHMQEYAERLQGQLVDLILKAVKNRQPARVDWAQGEVEFAANRRVLQDGTWKGFGVTPEAPVDWAMPMLRVTGLDGSLKAIVINYACHCTTLIREHNFVHGDWAGCAQQEIEAAHPGATALVVIGCGADANPLPRETVEAAQQHGKTVAAEVARLLDGDFQPLQFPLTARAKTIPLPYGPLPTREQLETDAQDKSFRTPLARHLLDRLDQGRPLPKSFDYTITTWSFGDALTMVFLPGEVVVDYALRLKRETPDHPLWVTAYVNAMPCYIASRRIIAEGGYEVDGSMNFYGHPTRLAPEVEDLIIETVQDLAGK